METPMLDRAILIVLLAAASWSVAHGGRLLMRRMKTPAWIAGVIFGFVAFLVNRLALAGAAWAIYSLLFGEAPGLLVLIALVGVASAPLLLSFAQVTPFFGHLALFVLYLITLVRLASLSSVALEMDWLGCLGWWTAAWVVTAAIGYGLRWLLRDATWLAWTGIFGPQRATPQQLLAELPGLRMGRNAQN
ncbi:MAG: hypothetical protein MUC34_12655 [Anaerolineae bacterium]|nr:hypothetical protein [Anaerolineae bacterium]